MCRAFLIPALLLCVLAGLPLSSCAQAKRTMSIDDLITTVRVSEPRVSPDGKRVVFTRTTTDLQSGKRNSDIWVVPSDGSAAARELIGGDKNEGSAQFTPDGKRIVFIST